MANRLRWLMNLYDPRLSLPKHTPEARAVRLLWLTDKVIGEPRATERNSVADLMIMSYVGIYRRVR